MTADAMFNDVTETAIDQANKLLAFLTDRSTPNWEQVFSDALSAQELELNKRNVALALERSGKQKPVGALLGGTGLAMRNAGLEGEDSQRAVRLLKQTGRLIQAGKGRGKALLVLDDSPLKAEDFVAAIANAGVAEPRPHRIQPVVEDKPDGYVSTDDVFGMLKGVNNAYRDLDARYNELLKERRELDQRSVELAGSVASLEAEIVDLKEQLASKDRLTEVTTWT